MIYLSKEVIDEIRRYLAKEQFVYAVKHLTRALLPNASLSIPEARIAVLYIRDMPTSQMTYAYVESHTLYQVPII